MGVRSDVGLAVKAELLEELREKHPWVFEEAGEEISHNEGRLLVFYQVKWYDFVPGQVSDLCDWLKSKDASTYLLVEACYEEPDLPHSGEWEDNPWELRKVLTVELGIKRCKMGMRSDILQIKREAHIAAQDEARALASYDSSEILLRKGALDLLEKAGFPRFFISPENHTLEPVSFGTKRCGEIGETWVHWAKFSRKEVEAYLREYEGSLDLLDDSGDCEEGDSCSVEGCTGHLRQYQRMLRCCVCGEDYISRWSRLEELILTLVGWDSFYSGPGKQFGRDPIIKVRKHHILVKQSGGLDV
jgi:hypothetical protein